LNPLDVKTEQGTVSFQRTNDSTLIVRLAGPWHLQRDAPSANLVTHELDATPGPKRIAFDTSQLTRWDSGLVTFLADVSENCRARGIVTDREGLPRGVRRLLELSEAGGESRDGRGGEKRTDSFVERVGNATIGYAGSIEESLNFIGVLTIAFGRFVRGKARYRRIDLVQVLQECGANAVGIVNLIAFLVGVILAFMGAVQLQQFGAAIYVADLVGIGMTRDMGAMMTAIIMAGRTGAAFAAQLGTMKVTQEIEALTTMGIAPMEFLVVPRVIALVLMMPLLCLFADFVGMLGGAFVGVTMLDVSLRSYYHETVSAVTLVNLFGGLFKATVYGALVALAGCLRGFQCGDSSSAVGDAATRAVVTAIVLVVVACGLFAFIFNVLGI
jgi:phospholipid/cholesterol/gamma-HCH transport system permease protein